MSDQPKDDGLSSTAQAMRASAPYTSATMKLVIASLAGAGGGYLLDARLGSKPWALLVGALLGVALGFYAFLKVVVDEGKKK